MKAAIIGASSESLHTIKKAKEYNLTVVALDGNEKAEGLAAADIAKVVNISKEAETIECVKNEDVDFVLTVPIGRYLTTIGSVNDALNLPGIGKEQAMYCTDKLLFHQTMAENGLRDCNCYEACSEKEDRDDLYDKIKTTECSLHFPAILKPRFGSGSRGIHFVNNLQELEQGLEKTLGESYVLEECMAGEEYGLDGAVIHGEFYLVLLRHKENTPLPARQAVAYFSVMPEDEFYGQVKLFMEQTVKVLGLNECLMHADLIRTEQGPFIIELSARPSGHNLHNLFTPLCTDVDLAEQYIRYRMGMEYSFVPEKTKMMMIHYFDMEGEVKEVPTLEQVKEVIRDSLVIWQCNIKEGDMLLKVSDGHSLMGRGFFVLEGKNEEKLLQDVKQIKSMFLLEKT
ncbi:MAG: ATP-grasp domain-containing protein [Lachnospiraceae bacterium]|nr:ATP-grasp domain-containing protein [Lachnospiraceae bacterium]